MKHQPAAGAGSTACVMFILMILLTLGVRARTAVRERVLLDSGGRFHPNALNGNSGVTPRGTPLTQWTWKADDNATNGH